LEDQVHVIHPDDLPEEIWQGFPFKTLVPPDLGEDLGLYILQITEANPHVHDDLNQIYIVIQGSGVMEIGDENSDIKPGCVVFIPKGKRHALTPSVDGPVTVYSLEYRAD
jgi:mannose-6-phosphate isomerase-like protein (cupin superfamily)